MYCATLSTRGAGLSRISSPLGIHFFLLFLTITLRFQPSARAVETGLFPFPPPVPRPLFGPRSNSVSVSNVIPSVEQKKGTNRGESCGGTLSVGVPRGDRRAFVSAAHAYASARKGSVVQVLQPEEEAAAVAARGGGWGGNRIRHRSYCHSEV